MGVHAEYMSAKYVEVSYAPEVNFDFPESPGLAPVLVFGADDVVVFEGTEKELLAMLERAVARIKAGPDPLEPDDDDEDEPIEAGDEVTCGCGFPILWTGEVWQHNAAPYLWGDDHEARPPRDVTVIREKE